MSDFDGHCVEQLSQQNGVQEHEPGPMSDEPCTAESICPDNSGLPEPGEQDPRLEEEWDVIEDFLSGLSCSNDFNYEKLFQEADDVLNCFCVDGNVQKTHTLKSRVVTFLFRQLSSLLCLSKNQNNKVVDFLKRVVVFISPDSEVVAKRIFASYDSCRRQSLKEADKKHVLCKQYLEQCLYFSIAADTALFQNEHFISCIARFSLESDAYELPLFIMKCQASSGEDLALFIFNNVREKNANFEKLVSITTDGASNMVGRFNGMVVNFKRLVDQHCRANNLRSPIIHTVWCFAHRINLVTRSVLSMRPLNFVHSFADWFSTKRRQVSYKKFLAEKFPNERLGVIPQPSETRWLFYRDVVRAIMTQTRFIELFVSEEADFQQFLRGSKRDVEKYGGRVEKEFSFSNTLIRATFEFAQFILDLLGTVNTICQERFASIAELWDFVQSLKMKINTFVEQDLEVFVRGLNCLAMLSVNEAAEFHNCLRGFKHCLDERFPCPSKSLDMNGRRHSIVQRVSSENESSRMNNCSVMPLLDFFTFPHLFVFGFEMSQTSCPPELTEEVTRIVFEMTTKRQQIIDVYNERRVKLSEKAGITVVTQTSLFDVFKVVKRENYPLLWREVVRIDTITPSTVSCERCFSVIKRSLHVNMKAETFIANVTNKLHGYNVKRP